MEVDLSRLRAKRRARQGAFSGSRSSAGVALLLALVLSGALGACASKEEPSEGETVTIVLVEGETALVNVSRVACVGGAPQLEITGELRSTGETSFVDLLVELDGSLSGTMEIIDPEDFQQTEEGPLASLAGEVPLPLGEHSVRLCLVSRDLEGETIQQGCLPIVEYDRDCGVVDYNEPSIVAERRREANENGWYTEPVTVHFTCSDSGSGIASCSDDITLNSEGRDLPAEGFAVDNAGNSASVVEFGVRIDWTPPEIVFIGAREYLVDERVEASCSITDALSGISESSCTGNSGEAYMFDLGSYPIEATAIDLAGNEARETAEFSVSATAASLCRLLKRFVLSRDTQSSLCAGLTSAEAAFANGEAQRGDDALDAFHVLVDEQDEAVIPADRAGTLIRLSSGLRPG